MSETPPTVSVVIAAYNAADFIGEALGSVLAQTYRDVEVIVVDDGSTDATAAVVRGFDEPVRLLQQANGGSASARNRGAQEARGRYVAFLDADDRWHPRKLARQMKQLQRRPEAAWAYTDALFFDSSSGAPLYRQSERQALPDGDVLRPLLLGNFITTPSVLVLRKALVEAGGFDASALHRISEDWDCWLRLAARHPVARVRAPLVHVREHAGRKTSTMNLDHARRSRTAFIKKAVRRDPERLADLEGRALAGVLVGIGRKHLQREERAAARRCFARAVCRDVTFTPAWTYGLAAFLPRPLLRVLGRLRRIVRQQGRP